MKGNVEKLGSNEGAVIWGRECMGPDEGTAYSQNNLCTASYEIAHAGISIKAH